MSSPGESQVKYIGWCAWVLSGELDDHGGAYPKETVKRER
jgi:hypothetical protein